MADETPNRHIAFICSKGDLDMAYPALVMGWSWATRQVTGWPP